MKRAFCLFVLFVFLLTSCNAFESQVSDFVKQNRSGNNGTSYTSPEDKIKDYPIIFYNIYPNQNRYWYYPETFLSQGDESLLVEAVNKTLAAISENLNLPNYKIEKSQINNGIVEIDLESKYTELLPPLNAVVTVGEALVMTLTEFSEVNKVQFLIDGQIVNFFAPNSAQFEVSLPVSRPLWPNEESQRPDQKMVFYWSLPKSDILVPITLPLILGEAVEKQVFNILLGGPESYLAGFAPSVELPNELDYQDVQIYREKEQIFLNFPFEPEDWFEHGMLLSIRAIVQTLTEIENVEKIQFLFQGKKRNLFYDDFNLGLPIGKISLLNTNN